MRAVAGQHVFGHLRKSQANRSQDGWQTIGSTVDLITADEIKRIESYAQFDPNRNDSYKWQHLRLTSGKHVVSRFVAIPEPDDYGRGGRFFVHSLVLGEAEWREIDSAPIPLLDGKYYFPNLADALTATDQGRLAPLDLANVVWDRSEALAELRAWGDRARDLEQVAAPPAGEVAGGAVPIVLIGPQLDVVRVLGALFIVAPATRRSWMTFDTERSCHIKNTSSPLWAVGLPEPPNSEGAVTIDTRTRMLTGLAPLGAGAKQASNRSRSAGPSVVPESIAATSPAEEFACSLIEGGECERAFQFLVRYLRRWPPSKAVRDMVVHAGSKSQELQLLSAIWNRDWVATTGVLDRMNRDRYVVALVLLNQERRIESWRLYSSRHATDWGQLAKDPLEPGWSPRGEAGRCSDPIWEIAIGTRKSLVARAEKAAAAPRGLVSLCIAALTSAKRLFGRGDGQR